MLATAMKYATLILSLACFALKISAQTRINSTHL